MSPTPVSPPVAQLSRPLPAQRFLSLHHPPQGAATLQTRAPPSQPKQGAQSSAEIRGRAGRSSRLATRARRRHCRVGRLRARKSRHNHDLRWDLDRRPGPFGRLWGWSHSPSYVLLVGITARFSRHSVRKSVGGETKPALSGTPQGIRTRRGCHHGGLGKRRVFKCEE